MVEHSQRLAVICVAIGIFVGAILVWASSQQPSPVNCNPNATGPTPLGTALAFGDPAESSVGSDHWYNITIQSAGGGLDFRNLDFQVQTAGRSIVVPNAGWNLTVLNGSSALIGSYSLSGTNAATWTSGGSVPLQSGDVFSLMVTPGNLSGDTLVVMETGTLSTGCPALGSTNVAIP